MKIGIFHYKIASTDGVSLEIEKRVAILEQLGHEVVLLGGSFDRKVNQRKYELGEFNIDSEINRELINQNIKADNINEENFESIFSQKVSEIENQLTQIFVAENFDLIIVHNIFSLPLLIWSAFALKKVIDNLKVKTVCVNHDFYFEREYFVNSSNGKLKEILNDIFPKGDNVTHEVINSLSAASLLMYHNEESVVLGDYWDFGKNREQRDEYNSDFCEVNGINPNDLIILQATRIVPRKAIEMAIYLASVVNEKIKEYVGFEFNGKKITSETKSVLVFSNYPHHVDSEDYFDNLVTLADNLGVKIVKAYERVAAQRGMIEGNKVYSFWDAYVFADMVTYPSVIEGFGNQFLEAAFYRKLVALFEYDVFRADIKKEGYLYVYLDEKWRRDNNFYIFDEKKMKCAAENVLRILTNGNLLKEITDYNFQSAKQNHDIGLLKKYIEKSYFENESESVKNEEKEKFNVSYQVS